MQSDLIGVDRRGSQGYQEVPCEICGSYFFISQEAESGICARCVAMGYPKPSPRVDIIGIKKAIESDSLKQYRKENKASQDEIAKILEITERHYRNLEKGQPISKIIRRKIEKKLAQVEQGQ
jgi:DNA-binding XRE family transcriptional regulator